MRKLYTNCIIQKLCKHLGVHASVEMCAVFSCAIHHKHAHFFQWCFASSRFSKMNLITSKVSFRISFILINVVFIQHMSLCVYVCVCGWVGGAVSVYVLPVKITNDFLTVSFIDRRCFCWGNAGIFVVSSLSTSMRPLSSIFASTLNTVWECLACNFMA